MGTKPLRAAWRALPFALIVAVFVSLLLYPGAEKEEVSAARIVTVWNVDTFEGGKGSRTAFLSRVARRTEKERDGVRYFVTGYGAEGALAALRAGKTPDILSFGQGLGEAAALGRPLSFAFSGGETAAGCIAVPWCGGKYSLYSLTDDFGDGGPVAVSVGGNNLSVVAAAFAGISGEETPSEAAYVGFLGGKYRYLLGTQRDACRFEVRGATVYARELPAYCDLYQYVSVCCADERGDCRAFLDELLSERTKEDLKSIGMYPAAGREESYTVSAFAPPEALAELASFARAGKDVNFLEKYLKRV